MAMPRESLASVARTVSVGTIVEAIFTLCRRAPTRPTGAHAFAHATKATTNRILSIFSCWSLWVSRLFQRIEQSNNETGMLTGVLWSAEKYGPRCFAWKGRCANISRIPRSYLPTCACISPHSQVFAVDMLIWICSVPWHACLQQKTGMQARIGMITCFWPTSDASARLSDTVLAPCALKDQFSLNNLTLNSNLFPAWYHLWVENDICLYWSRF